jgi:hypothetical protein
LQRRHGRALRRQRLSRARAREKLLRLAHRDGRRPQIALTAILQPARLQLARLLRLDLLVFDFAASMNTNSARIIRCSTARFSAASLKSAGVIDVRFRSSRSVLMISICWLRA